jgi:hypothetical protein
MTKLFLSSFIQIGLVAINTILLARGYVLGIFMASSTISLIWTFNVQKISVSKLKEKRCYSLGAGCGAVAGFYIINQILN